MKNLLKIFVCVIFVWGCSTPKYLSAPKDFKNHVKGLYLEYTTKKSHSREIAEIIEVKDKYIKLLPVKNEKIISIKQNDIKYAHVLVSLTSDNQKKLNTWAGLLNINSLVHGYFMVFSLPINLVSTYSTSIHARGAYRMKIPDDVKWHELHKFARFPQGIPELIDENLIK
ncbi:hypothetical protein E1J38_002610 [Seonamhaeicola sediminis]|uniref:Uncharacterized protein n=1 Tax=Seonamhaeicola sediminis TaxID=2528206 RepID=A0A562YJA2_9FLAO|nr:hypothetical protein [Seonamhaeicola sediminis]TWO34769.1 hypothetical protein E1J38_002610 [Seonamhaeicola sediminis]